MTRPTPSTSASPTEPEPARATRTIAVCIVAKNEEEHIARSVTALVPLRDSGVVADLVVIDGGSTDQTAACATAAGARVIDAAAVFPELGPLRGKGDTLWRGASQVPEDLLVVLDADIYGDLAGIVTTLVAPLLADGSTARFVKGYFARTDSVEQLQSPADATDTTNTSDTADTSDTSDSSVKGAAAFGGRVTELVARPLIAIVAPTLSWCAEPLSGQIAIERELLWQLPVVTDYGLEIAMLFDVFETCGRDAIAEVDLGTIFNPPQADQQLAGMARDVMTTLLHRVQRAGRTHLDPQALASVDAQRPVERPPLATMMTAPR